MFGPTLSESSFKEIIMAKKVLLGSFLILAVSLAGLAQQPPPAQKAAAAAPAKIDIAGEWELTLQTPQGEMPMPATFALENEVLKVTLVGPMGEMKGEGKITGAELEWTITVSTPQGDFLLSFKGKVEGEEMTGQVQMGDFGTSDFRGKRKK